MTHLTPIDIRKFPDLVRLAEEVQATKKARILKRDREPIAVLTPIQTTAKPRKKGEATKADYEAFRAAAGSWKDVDVEKFKADNTASRRISTRPAVKL